MTGMLKGRVMQTSAGAGRHRKPSHRFGKRRDSREKTRSETFEEEGALFRSPMSLGNGGGLPDEPIHLVHRSRVSSIHGFTSH